jgi:LmbE family N-acetylglucosaminyl deacetylase
MRIERLDDIAGRFRHVFLSPHYDDVVYSCGGTLGVLAGQGERPLVITVFGGEPAPGAPLTDAAVAKHRRMGMADPGQVRSAIALRRKEDALALEMCGADHLWLGHVDAIYRGVPPRYPRRELYLGGAVHASDRTTMHKISTELLGVARRLPGIDWYAPMGVGRHVDHQLVHTVAMRLAGAGASVSFYEDFPYVVDEGALGGRLEAARVTFEPHLFVIGERLSLRTEASRAYRSQLLGNFGSEAAFDAAFSTYPRSLHADPTLAVERYWRCRTTERRRRLPL